MKSPAMGSVDLALTGSLSSGERCLGAREGMGAREISAQGA